MTHKPRVSRDQALRLLVRWHLQGVTYRPAVEDNSGEVGPFIEDMGDSEMGGEAPRPMT